MATMWYNYLQGDLFERFCRDNLLTPSYFLRGTQSNCIVRAHCHNEAVAVVSDGKSRRLTPAFAYWWQCTGWHQSRSVSPRCSFGELSLFVLLFPQAKNCPALSSAQPDHRLPWQPWATVTDGVWMKKKKTGWSQKGVYLPLFTVDDNSYNY